MRPPEVFVRELSPEEGNRRAAVEDGQARSQAPAGADLLGLCDGPVVPVIARLVGSDESHVRKVIHAFNERGFGALDPDWRGGCPRRLTDRERERIVSVAGARPDSLGVPVPTRWGCP